MGRSRFYGRRRGGIRSAVVALLTTVGSVAFLPSARADIVAPNYVRTIGTPGHSEIYPSGLDVDTSGNVYVADTGNDQIVKYPAGSAVESWRVGTRGATMANGSFSNPRDLAVATSHLYVADTDNNTVQMLDLSGHFVKTFNYQFKTPIGISMGTDGSGSPRVIVSEGTSGNVLLFDLQGNLLLAIPPHAGGLSGTRDAATDSNGNVYAADFAHDLVQKYNKNGTWLMQWGGSTAPDCQKVNAPYGVAVDAANRIYIASSDLGVIKVFNPDGSCVGSYGVRGTGPLQIQQLRRVAVGQGTSPTVYAADLWGLKVLAYDHDGSAATPERLGTATPAPAGGLNENHGVAVSSQFVFVMDTINQRVDRFNLDGTGPVAWGDKGVSPDSFNWPNGIAVNPMTGNIWVADTRNNRLVEYAPDGTGPLTTFGDRTTSPIFNWPMGLAFDPQGNVYIADTANNLVQSYTPGLAFRWSHGGSGSGTDKLRRPQGVDYDGVSGRVLVADTENSRLVSLNPATGNVIAVLPPTKGSGAGQLSKPAGLAAAADGGFWVSDSGNNRIERFDAAGNFAMVLLGGTAYGNSNSQFNNPVGIEIGPDGLLYVADTFNDRVQVFSEPTPPPPPPTPTYLRQIYDAGGVAPLYPGGGTESPDGSVYIADSAGNRILKFDPAMNQTPIAAVGLNQPRAVTLDNDPTKLWVADTNDHQILEMMADGTVLKTFGGSGILNTPIGLYADSTGLYVADTYNFRIVKMSKGDGSFIWTQGTCFNLKMNRPRALTIGPDGKLYVSDTANNRILVMDPADGTCLSVFASKGATAGKVNQPYGMVSDGGHGLWLADGGNYRIQHILIDGTVVQVTGSFGTGAGQFTNPAWVFWWAGKLAVTEPYGYRVERFTLGGGNASYSDTVGGVLPANGGFNQPFGVAYGPSGELYAMDMLNHRLEKFNPDGTFARAWGGFGSANGYFQFPRGVAVSPDGATIVVTDSENNRLDLFTATGSFIKSVTPKSSGLAMSRPTQATIASDGSYWVADTWANRVLHLSSTGTVLANFNHGGAMKKPDGIAVDATGLVYVATQNTVEKYDASGNFIKTLTTAGQGSTNANSPGSLAIAGSGSAQRLFIADSGNGRVVVLTLDGVPVMTFGSKGSGLAQFLNPSAVAVNPVNGEIVVSDFDGNKLAFWNAGL